jgi:hypothetical protein
MQQGFSQYMKGKIIRVTPNACQDGFKFRATHETRRPKTSMAETAREIAAVGDFDIDFFKFFQFHRFSFHRDSFDEAGSIVHTHPGICKKKGKTFHGRCTRII